VFEETAPMSDTHAHGPSTTKPFLVVFGALCIFTAVSFVVNSLVRGGTLTTSTGFVLILGVACVKALLVVIYFMHLKWDWGRLYFLIIPALVLAPMMIFALLPDLVLFWSNLPGWQHSLPK
jgi:cytochrome c oxidase subunit 4